MVLALSVQLNFQQSQLEHLRSAVFSEDDLTALLEGFAFLHIKDEALFYSCIDFLPHCFLQRRKYIDQ